MQEPIMPDFTAYNTGTLLYSASELEKNISDKFYRFGYYDPSNGWCPTREYFFISKPDLHLMDGTQLYSKIDNPYFRELLDKYPEIICELQKSYQGDYGHNSPFISILTNKARTNLDLPGFDIESMDTGLTAYNDNVMYMQSSLIQDDHHEFTIEFEEDVYVRVFRLIQAWDEYEKLKLQGGIYPPNRDYILKKILHDQSVAYKIVVDQNGENILFAAMAQGVYPLKVPADAFSDCSNGIETLSIPFHANWITVNKPQVLMNFKNTIKGFDYGEKVKIFDEVNWHTNIEPARCPDIEFNTGYHAFNKLIWRR